MSEKAVNIPGIALWELTEDRGMQMLDPESESTQAMVEAIESGAFMAEDTKKTHQMRVGSILVAAESSFAFHPDDIAAK